MTIAYLVVPLSSNVLESIIGTPEFQLLKSRPAQGTNFYSLLRLAQGERRKADAIPFAVGPAVWRAAAGRRSLPASR
jgi:hypothetical protein